MAGLRELRGRRLRGGDRPAASPLMMFVAGAATVLVAVALVSLFSGDDAKRAAAGRSEGPPAAAAAPAVLVRRTRLGRILTDARGLTLYLFLEDKGGRSHCFGSCARVWPPALVSGTPRPGPGVDGSKLTTTRRGGARRQLVYNGHPLYRMNADTRPGQLAGEGFLGTWWAVSPAGRQVVAPGMKVARGGGY